ncbi:unnamed protein product [Sympodiomycopsis kandeliae]
MYRRLSDEVILNAESSFGFDINRDEDYQDGQGMVLYWVDPSFAHDELTLDVVKSIRDLLSRGTEYRYTGGKKRIKEASERGKYKDPDGAWTGDTDETT